MGAVRELADRYLAALCRLDPVLAVNLGEPSDDTALTDHSPDGVTARVDLARQTLTALDAAAIDPADDGDRLCASLLRDRLGLMVEQAEAGEPYRALRLIGSPIGSTRSVFDLMPRDTDEQWAAVIARIEAVPAAYASIRAGLEHGVGLGVVAARRQADACAQQLATWAGDGGRTPWFATYAAAAPAALPARRDAAVAAATEAMASLSAWLRTAYPARTTDPVGADAYAVAARQFLGARLDTGEAYAWAWDELARIEAEMTELAGVILPFAGGEHRIEAAFDHLNTHGPAIEGEAALRRWLQDLMDSTVAELDGPQFDIDPRIHRVEAMIAPPGTAAAQYYTSPSFDLSRPGRTWYPTMGKTRFPIWSEVSTCYHEGVPGHHLQLATWRLQAERLSRFQVSSSISGNIEGWALYAERLMDELGHFADPGVRLGYLVAQQMRATRVIVDIGMHLALPIPAGQPFHPGERFTPELGREFLFAHAGKDDAFLQSEWVRYLGWPAQAICYKLGERVWLEGRAEAQRLQGPSFDLKAWHMKALRAGSLGLDDLRAELVSA